MCVLSMSERHYVLLVIYKHKQQNTCLYQERAQGSSNQQPQNTSLCGKEVGRAKVSGSNECIALYCWHVNYNPFRIGRILLSNFGLK